MTPMTLAFQPLMNNTSGADRVPAHIRDLPRFNPTYLGRYAIDLINRRITRDAWSPGESFRDRTGKTYLVGPDGALRSVGRVLEARGV